MTETCGRCGRPARMATSTKPFATCWVEGSSDCEIASAAYQRGLREGRRQGVEIAKVRARAVIPYREPWGEFGPRVYEPPKIDWSDVDAELERMERDD